MAKKIKGAGLYQDRDHMGKLPMAQKVTEYFPQQYNPYNPDNYYAGDVADGTAQRMGDAPLSQKKRVILEGPDGLDKYGNPKPLVAKMDSSALRKGVHDAQTDIDGRAIDANKPQAQMKEAGAKQVGPGHKDFDVLKHLEESRPGPGMRFDRVPGKENPITPGIGNTSLSPTPGKGGGGGGKIKTPDPDGSDKPVTYKPTKPKIWQGRSRSKYLGKGGSHFSKVRITKDIHGLGIGKRR